MGVSFLFSLEHDFRKVTSSLSKAQLLTIPPIAANIADTGVLSFDACFPDSVVGFNPVSLLGGVSYFEYFVRTAKARLNKYASSTAQKNINLSVLNEVFIPLPSLAEQKRIVSMLDSFLSLCDNLITQTVLRAKNSEAFTSAMVQN